MASRRTRVISGWGHRQRSCQAPVAGLPWSGRIGTRSVQPGVEADTWPLGVGGEGVTRSRPGAA